MFPPTHPALDRALAERGYDAPTPVQEAVLQAEASGRDLLVSAQTGSGKTVAYGLAMAPTILGSADRVAATTAALALIIAPTRELAMQVQRELAWLYGPTGARIASCIGGMDARGEAEALRAGAAIVVGTPGRLCDHLRRGRLDLSALRVVVLDEADEMLDLGFKDELDTLLDACPRPRRTLLFSATIARNIADLARQYQDNALRIDTLVRNQPHADIEYRAVRVAYGEGEHAVVNVLRHQESPTALVFCATREAVRHLHASLLERGFSSVALSGELTQNERTRALQSLRDGQARVCVATDVAARGLDLPDLGLVIHADLPSDRANLLHRSGRTGRAGRKGLSVLIVPASRARRAEQLLAAAGVSASWGAAPSPEDIRARDAERLLADPALGEPPTEEDRALAKRLLQGRGAEEIAAALIHLHRSRLPAPEEITAPSQPREAAPARPPRDPRGRALRDQSDAPPPRTPGPMQWFSINIGRSKNADPKWLVPLLCRFGGVTKHDIGSIRIFDHQSKFEIHQDCAAGFITAGQSKRDDGVAVHPATPPSGRHAPGAAHRPTKHKATTRKPSAR